MLDNMHHAEIVGCISEAIEERLKDVTAAVPGMTLRDYLAAQAMNAAAINPVGADGFNFIQRARWAYQQADAMLKAREET